MSGVGAVALTSGSHSEGRQRSVSGAPAIIPAKAGLSTAERLVIQRHRIAWSSRRSTAFALRTPSFLLMSVKRNEAKKNAFSTELTRQCHACRHFSTRGRGSVEQRPTSMCAALRVCGQIHQDHPSERATATATTIFVTTHRSPDDHRLTTRPLATLIRLSAFFGIRQACATHAHATGAAVEIAVAVASCSSGPPSAAVAGPGQTRRAADMDVRRFPTEPRIGESEHSRTGHGPAAPSPARGRAQASTRHGRVHGRAPLGHEWLSRGRVSWLTFRCTSKESKSSTARKPVISVTNPSRNPQERGHGIPAFAGMTGRDPLGMCLRSSNAGHSRAARHPFASETQFVEPQDAIATR